MPTAWRIGRPHPEVDLIAKSKDPVVELMKRGLGGATSMDEKWLLDIENNFQNIAQALSKSTRLRNRTRRMEMLYSMTHLQTLIEEDYARPKDFWIEKAMIERGQTDYRRPLKPGMHLRLRVGIVGGSISGMMAALMLLRQGHDVYIFEKSPTRLQERGIPIILQQNVRDFLVKYRICPPEVLGVVARNRSLNLDQSGVRWSRKPIEDEGGAVVVSYQTLHNAIKRTIRRGWADRYIHGAAVTSLTLDSGRKRQQHSNATSPSGPVTMPHPSLQINNKSRAIFDLIIGADGETGMTRRTLEEEKRLKPGAFQFENYIGYHGTIPETLAPKKVSMLLRNGSDLLCYAPAKSRTNANAMIMPGIRGERHYPFRRIAWTWYRNLSSTPRGQVEEINQLFQDKRGKRHKFELPQGLMKPENVKKLHERAKEELPDWLSSLIESTWSPGVFRVRYDMALEAEFDGQIVLIGDALSKAGPHYFFGPYKAVEQVEELERAVRLSSNRTHLAENLRIWSIKVRRLGYVDLALGQNLGHLHQEHDEPRTGYDLEWSFPPFSAPGVDYGWLPENHRMI